MDLCQHRVTLREGTPLAAWPQLFLKLRRLSATCELNESRKLFLDYVPQPSNQKREANTTEQEVYV